MESEKFSDLKVIIVNKNTVTESIIQKIENIVNLCSGGCYDPIVQHDFLWFIFYNKREDTPETIDDDRNKILGCFRISTVNDTVVLSHFCVLPEHREKNLGTSMLQYLEGFFRSQKLVTLVTLSVDITNKVAIDMYENAGFEKYTETNTDCLYHKKYS
jgi:ribosomal protein S18 acetylase RimI-like enzyme